MRKETCKACINIINGVKTRKTVLHTCSKTNKEIMKLMKETAIQDFYDTLTYKGD